MKLEAKVALVTGSSGGIGQAIAVRLAQEGADIVIDYRSHPEGAKETLTKVEAAGRKGCVVKADLGVVSDVRQLVAQGIDQFGKLDILVNNAGVEKNADFWKVSEADYDAAVSKFHESHPYIFAINGHEYRVNYEPAESSTGLFGGNSNWRGPVWFPINYLIIESLQKFYHYFGDDFKVECPTGSGQMMTLWEVATELAQRLIRTFLKNSSGRRPAYGSIETFQTNPHWRDLILFNEYYHGDIGAGLGASHQTGWTGLVANLIQQYAEYGGENQAPELIEKQVQLLTLN